jgi:NADH-quinone oxidoreductase subunit J
MGLSQMFFMVCAAMVLATALAVVFTRHAVYAALFFVAHLVSLSAVYGLLNAPLIAVLQVMVYAGAVVVLFIFAMMILDASVLPRRSLKKEAFQAALAAALAGALGFLLAYGLTQAAGGLNLEGVLAIPKPGTSLTPEIFAVSGVTGVARILFREYLLPFEMISILLVVALVGIMVMARRKMD